MNNADTNTDSLWEQIKQVLREFFQGSRERVSGLAGTIDRQASIRKLTARIGLLRRERRQLLLTMGKKAYSLYTRGKVRNRDILEDCLRIDEIETDIGELQDHIEELRRQGGPEEDLVVELEDEQPVAEQLAEPMPETEESAPQVDEQQSAEDSEKADWK